MYLRVNRAVSAVTAVFNIDAPQFMTTRTFNSDRVDEPLVWLMQCARLRVHVVFDRLVIIFVSVLSTVPYLSV